jgi:hypothetical protein
MALRFSGDCVPLEAESISWLARSTALVSAASTPSALLASASALSRLVRQISWLAWARAMSDTRAAPTGSSEGARMRLVDEISACARATSVASRNC